MLLAVHRPASVGHWARHQPARSHRAMVRRRRLGPRTGRTDVRVAPFEDPDQVPAPGAVDVGHQQQGQWPLGVGVLEPGQVLPQLQRRRAEQGDRSADLGRREQDRGQCARAPSSRPARQRRPTRRRARRPAAAGRAARGSAPAPGHSWTARRCARRHSMRRARRCRRRRARRTAPSWPAPIPAAPAACASSRQATRAPTR